MLTRSPQWVHSTGPWTAALYPGAVPKCGLSASGERPRQPLMHSVEPGGGGPQPTRAAYGFGTTGDAVELSPSINVRLTQLRHIDNGSRRAFESAQRSSSSQSPT